MNHEDSHFYINPEFWKDFHTHYFGKRPTIIKNKFERPVATIADVKESLIKTAEALNKEEAVLLRFYIENSVLQKDVNSMLPGSDGASLTEYIETTSRKLGGRQFGIVVNGINQYLPGDVQNRFKYFLKGLFEVAGRPKEGGENALFLSKYKETPFGVHKDKSDIFCFVLEGNKRIRVWPFEIFKNKCVVEPTPHTERMLNLPDYRDYLDQSILLEGKPGDILYWPASYWHVGEGDPEQCHTVSLHVGLVYPPRKKEVSVSFSEKISELVTERVRRNFYSLNSKNEGQNISSVIRSVKKEMNQFINDMKKMDLEKVAVETMLDYSSGFFLKEKASQNHPDVVETDRLAVNKDFPIFYSKTKGALVVSINGHGFALPYHQDIVSLIKKLNTGKIFTAQEIIDEIGGSSKRRKVKKPLTSPQILRLLTQILSRKGISLIDSPASPTESTPGKNRGLPTRAL